MIKFSVVIPVYNAEAYIEECVMSFVNQIKGSYTFEAILVDDGSTDSSLKICENLAMTHRFVKVIKKQNEGCVIARKAGVLAAQGEYIVNCDSDDIVRNDMLLKISEILKEQDVDFVLFDLQKVKNGVCGEIVSQKFLKSGLFNVSEALSTVCRCSTFNSIVIKCCKKETIIKCFEACENLQENIGEDLQISSKLFLLDIKGYYLPESLYFYRENCNSVTHTCSKLKAIKGFLVSHHFIYNLLETNNDNCNLGYLYGYVIREIVYFWFQFLNDSHTPKRVVGETYETIFADKLVKAASNNLKIAKVATKYKIVYRMLQKKRFMLIKLFGKRL